MDKLYITLLCLVATVVIRADQQNRDVVVLNLYHNHLDFFDSFLSPDELYVLEYSAEDIPFEAFQKLYTAWGSYTTMTIVMFDWCLQSKYTIVDITQNSTSLLADRDEFVIEVHRHIKMLKAIFDSIATIDHTLNTNKENSQGQAIVTRNITQTSKSPIEGNTTQTFDDKITYAKSLLNEAYQILYVLHNNSKNDINLKETVTACKPILDSAEKPVPKIPEIVVLPSKEETLRVHSSRCSGNSSICEAILSKTTMKRFVKAFPIKKTISGFFNAIGSVNSTQQCKDEMRSFIQYFYFSWVLQVPKMEKRQFLNISICLNVDKNYELTIVN